MKKINKPNLDSKCVFEKCINSFQDRSLYSKNALISMMEYVMASHDHYHKHGMSSTLHLFKENEYLLDYGNLDDFEKLYKSGLSNIKKSEPYDFYKKIKSGFNDNNREQRCAFCCIHRVSEIDHFLPKSIFKTLAVEPLNLLPICRDCNKEKGDFYSLEKGMIHPYFDDVKQVWLYIHFSMKESFLLTNLTIENNNQIPDLLFDKIKITVEELKILESYKTYLIDDCDTIRTTLEGYSTIEQCLIWIKSERDKRQKIMDINHPTRRLYECAVDYIAQFSDVDSLLSDD